MEGVKVFFRIFGCLYYAKIVPIAQLPYTPSPAYDMQLPDELREVVEPIWLSTQAREDVRLCLERQGLDPWDYITPATVHNQNKTKKNQGIIYTIYAKNITYLANLNKPFPSKDEIQKLFTRFVENNFKGKNLKPPPSFFEVFEVQIE
ncbi:MAG: hypothetical protein QXG39_10070 [Candidatus Aenigmatarchaeota archaeon]